MEQGVSVRSEACQGCALRIFFLFYMGRRPRWAPRPMDYYGGKFTAIFSVSDGVYLLTGGGKSGIWWG